MSFLYVFGAGTSRFPLIGALAHVFGLAGHTRAFYIIKFLDAYIYFWLPQINITILWLFQGRNLRHRMVGRTVLVGGVPWVPQSAEAFLSKLFACSYSIAGLNVLSGNPAECVIASIFVFFVNTNNTSCIITSLTAQFNCRSSGYGIFVILIICCHFCYY